MTMENTEGDSGLSFIRCPAWFAFGPSPPQNHRPQVRPTATLTLILASGVDKGSRDERTFQLRNRYLPEAMIRTHRQVLDGNFYRKMGTGK